MASDVSRFRNILDDEHFVWFVLFGLFTKFCIVLVTYQPYTLAKIYLPLLLLLFIGKVSADHDWDRLLGAKFLLAYAVLATYVLPIGFLSNPHDWPLYFQNLTSLLSYILIFLTVTYVSGSDRVRHRIILTALTFCAIGAAYILAQWLFGLSYVPGHVRYPNPASRPSGILDDPNYSASLFLVGFFLSLYFFHMSRSRLAVRMALSAMLGMLFLVSIYVSQSLSAYGSLVIGVLVYVLMTLLFVGRKSSRRLRLGFIFLCYVGIVIVFIAFVAAYEANMLGLASRIEAAKSANVLDRINSYKLAINMLAANPWFGAGPWNDFNPVVHADLGVPKFDIIHNTLLSALGNTGIVGAAALLLLVGAGFKQINDDISRREGERMPPAAAALIALAMSVHAQSFSLHMITSMPYWFVLMLPFLRPAAPGMAHPLRDRPLSSRS